MFAAEVPPPPAPVMEAVPPPPAPDMAPELSPARRRRHRRRAGGGAERVGAEGGKPRSLDEELQQVGWMLREFKTAPCSLESPSSHDHRCCPFYHSSRDRRRPIAGDGLATYKGEPCPGQFDDGRTCSVGDACTKCHSTAELLYHPDFFRKRLCHQARRCPRGRFCAFAHARHELLAPHFNEEEEGEPSEEFIASRFKTQWCPIGGPHDWESCVYAHTYRDWRRVPLLGYSSHPCPRWAASVASGSPGLSYNERCPYGFACPLAHGAKEQLYHPQFYKTSPCSDPECRRGPLCAFTHGEHDQRQLPLEEAAPRAVRKPIPHAEELLRQHQPNFSEPPMYHALEDAPRGGGGSGASKPRRRKGGGGGGGEAVSSAAPPQAPAPAVPAQVMGDASRREVVGHMPAMALPFGQDRLCQPYPAACHPYPACQFMGYQWVLSPAGPPQQPQHGAFFGACYAPGAGYAPAAPVAPPASMAPGAAQCLLTVPQPQQQAPQPQVQHAPPQAQQPPQPPLRLPSPSPEDSPVRVSHHRGAEDMADAADRSPMVMSCNPRSPMDLKLPTMPRIGSPCNLSIEVPDFCVGGPEFVDFASWQRNLAESLEASASGPSKSGRVSDWKRRYGATEGGLRTPSSFGSPALSLAPTRASSPRSAEGASSTHTGDMSEPNVWDECNAPREEAALVLER